MASRFTTSIDTFTSQRFDFIIIGGGTAGLAVASRLAQDGFFTVGVLEAGNVADGEEDVEIPAHYGGTLGGRFDWQFKTVPQLGLSGRTLQWPRGKALGGTSALNFMAWVRASREDYDAWEALGNRGWGWDDLLPFFKKSETFHPPSEALRKEYDIHCDPAAFGTSGPIQVSYPPNYSPSHQLWHGTLNALGVETNTAHVAGSNVGVWTNLNAVDPRTATRSYSTAYCSNSTNIHILTDAMVNEIVFRQTDGECVATGVRFTFQGQKYLISASREVILSAGSVQSPQILELSGIGNPDVLSQAGIPVKVNNPRVGENLQEHMMLALVVEVDSNLTNPDDLKNDKAYMAAAREQYSRDQSGPLTILPCSFCYVPFVHFMPANTLAALSSRAETLAAFSPEKQTILKQRLNGHAKLGQIEYIFDIGKWCGLFQGEDGKKYGTMVQILQYPFSVGSIHIRPLENSRTQPKELKSVGEGKPLIDPGYYRGTHGELDLDVMRECIRFASNIFNTAPLSNIIRAPADPSASTMADEDELKEWIIDNTITDWHPVGTCAMGGSAGIRDGVVDERLRVYGVKGLRVVDASVIPLQISAHPQATIYAIAEKAAHMILEDAGRA